MSRWIPPRAAEPPAWHAERLCFCGQVRAMKWVTSVDDKVHIDRPGGQAMREWSETATAKSAPTAKSSS